MIRLLDTASLRGRLVLLVGLLVCALITPLSIALPMRVEGLSHRSAESRAMGIARLLAAATEAAMDFEDAVAAEALLEKLGSTRGAAWAALLRPDGTALARWQDPPAAIAPCRRGERQVEYGGGLIMVRIPVEARTGKVGTLALAFDIEEFRTRQHEIHKWLTTGAVLALLFGIMGAFLIGTLVTRPLRRMTRVAERIADGDLAASHDLQTGRRDECGALARAFELMLERLNEKRTALACANTELGEKLAELRRTQEQLVTADRRISVGRLAAGVAHEVSNPLAYVSSNLRYVAKSFPLIAAALDSVDPGERKNGRDRLGDMREATAQAYQGTERIRQIVKGLKSFSRDDDDHRERLQVTVPLDAALAMAGHEIRQRAQLLRDYGAVPMVEASEVRLSQVFLNLLINAAQAIPEGDPYEPTVTVSTRIDPSGWAVVEVRDTGCGIPPEVRSELFKPFFTTKPAGVGTGLGLSISQGIVEALGGRIEVESEVGRGSAFRVLLPPAAETAASPEPPPRPPGPRTITSLLVVDDEPLVCTALERALESEFHVVAVTTATAAMELIAAQRFDHVLCDLMMPDMNGAAFHAEVARRHPEIAGRMIFMTAGAFTPATQDFLSKWKGGLLEKPIDFDRLRRLIHAAHA